MANESSPDCKIDVFDYQLIDFSKPTHTISVQEIIFGKAEFSFNLVRDWSQSSRFWAKAVKISGVDEGKQNNGINCIRHFTANNRSYSEKLLDVDMQGQAVTYGLLRMVPALLRGAVTKISFQASGTDDFLAKWECVFQPVFNSAALIASIKGAQTDAYKDLLSALQFFNRPVLGSASIAITSGTATVSPNYIGIRVAHGPMKIVKTSADGAPRDPVLHQHSIQSYDDQVVVALYNRTIIGNDSVIATGYMPIRDVKMKRTCAAIELKNTSGMEVGKYKFIMAVEWKHPEPSDDAKKLGMTAFAVFDVIKREALKFSENMVNNVEAQGPLEYSVYDRALGQLPKHCTVLPPTDTIPPKRIAQLFQRSTEYIYSQAPVIGIVGIMANLNKAREQKNVTDDGKKALKDAYDLLHDPFLAPFKGMWMEEPKQLLKNLKDPVRSDLEFCAQLIRGANPMMITVAKGMDEIPKDLHDLKDPQGRDISTLVSSKSLFFCDYAVLGVGDYDEELGVYTNQACNLTRTSTMGPVKFWYTPFLAVYKNQDGRLDILGFILTRFQKQENTVYSRKSTPPNLYKLAKFHLACADNLEHQFVEHIGVTHMCMEPFAIALNNAFPHKEERHPIGVLLHPHFQDTIAVNYLVRQTLESDVASFMDATFSTGTMNGMRIFSQVHKKWDFIQSNFVNHLKSRGFDENGSDGLLHFYYRDDGFALWNILLKYHIRICTRIYGTDVAVALDSELENWCNEMRDLSKAAIPSFPKNFTSIAGLAEAVTTIVFHCSAQHAAVNYSQLRYMSYVPNRPDSMRLPMISPADGDTDLADDALYAALPSMSAGQFQTMFSYLLSTPPDNTFSGYDTFTDRFPQDVQQLRFDLEDLSSIIRQRNEELVKAGNIPYEYLNPASLAQSINI